MNTIIPLAFFKATGNAGLGIYKIRLINIDRMTVGDVPVSNIKKALLKGAQVVGVGLNAKEKVIIEDARFVNSTLIEIYEDRTVVSGAGVHTILFKIKGAEAYIICDYKGRPKAVTRSELLGYNILNRLCTGVFGGTPREYEVLGDYKVFEVDDKTLTELEKRKDKEDRMNAKLAMMRYPYKIYGDTIDIIDMNANKLDIVCPVKYINDEKLVGMHELRTIIFPRTFEKADILNILFNTHVEKIKICKNTLITGMNEYEEFRRRGHARNIAVEIYD